MPSLPPIRPEDEAVAQRIRPDGAFDAPADSLHDPERFDYLLRLGDDALILGQRLRSRISETGFRKVFLISLAILGAVIVTQALSRS